MPTYKGWKPDYKKGGQDEVKWNSIVKWTKKRKVEPRLSLVKGVWKNYVSRHEEEGGRIAAPLKPGKVSAKDYLERIRAKKKVAKEKNRK